MRTQFVALGLALVAAAATAQIGGRFSSSAADATTNDSFANASGAIIDVIDDAPNTMAPARSKRADFDAQMAAIQRIINSPSSRTSGDVMGAKLARFRGKPAQYAFNQLGYPDRKLSVAGAVVYTWSHTDANIDGGALSCTLKVVTRRGVISSTDFYGNNGACALYARKLDPNFRGNN